MWSLCLIGTIITSIHSLFYFHSQHLIRHASTLYGAHNKKENKGTSPGRPHRITRRSSCKVTKKMMNLNISSMNAMVDSITDAVENAIIHGNQSGESVASWCRVLFVVPYATSTTSGSLSSNRMAIMSVIHRCCRPHQVLSPSPGSLGWRHHH